MDDFRQIEWDQLANRLTRQRCTPFIGAGASRHLIPDADTLTRDWITRFELPVPEDSPLAYVAQMVAAQSDPMEPKERLATAIEKAEPYDPSASNDPYGVLSRLPVSIYITTNYDDYMASALKAVGRDPQTILCPWNHELRTYGRQSVKDPTYEAPWVYHLHGHHSVPESMVLTEDDYTDFMVNVSNRPDLFHHRIERILGRDTLLLIGYSLRDYTFRVLFRGLVAPREQSITRSGITVQLPKPPVFPAENDPAQAVLDRYFRLNEQYFRNMNFRVFWGDMSAFLEKLETEMNKATVG